MYNDTEGWWTIRRGTDLSFQNWHKEFEKFWLDHLSLKNLHFNRLLLTNAYNVWAKKNTEELYFMTLESDAKFEEKLTCCLENDIRNLAKFHQSTRKSQDCLKKVFYWVLLYKVENARV